VLPAWALTAEEEAKLLASDGEPEDDFGDSVATSGDTAIIGAPGDDDLAAGSGAAYVFIRTAGGWTEQAELLASDGGFGDTFGDGVALDGDTALIGAPLDDDNGQDTGAAYVFTRTGGVWSEQAKLLASDGVADEWFGREVALDGDTALIGAHFDDDNGTWSGSAYVFTRTAGVWTEQAKLLPADGGAFDFFGADVALDGNTALIGANSDDDSGSAAGAAYVFTRTAGVWTEQAKLLASDGAAGDSFGRELALDGDTGVIGAWEDDNDNGESSGSAYVFTRTEGIWTEQAKLLAADGAAYDWFGSGIALDGNTALIGAGFDDDNGQNSGSAYVFTRTGGVWTERAKLLASDGAAVDWFGVSVALDGDTSVIGANRDDDDGLDSGSAYVFRLYDDNVPATGIVGSLLLLLAVLGTGVYFMRRRASL
jgi:hypothetical protein